MMEDVFDTIKAQLLPQIDALISRDIRRLSRFGDIGFDDSSFRIDKSSFVSRAAEFMDVRKARIDYSAFDSWYKENDYTVRFPKYTATYTDKDLLEKKAFEHWLSLDETKTAPGGTFLDVGCATSPFSDLVEADLADTCSTCYRVDLPLPEYGFKPGINGKVVGCTAADIPFESGSVSRIYSHNAIEHFEGQSYFGFFKESARLLKKDGMIYICPLFFAEKTFTYTSLAGIYRRLSFPAMIKDMPIVYSDKVGQPYALQIGLEDLRRRLVSPLKGEVAFSLVEYENSSERNYGVDVALRGVRL